MPRLTEHWFHVPPSLGNVPSRGRHHLSGKPSNNRHTSENFATRFWRKVAKRGSTECWPWVGGKLANGRGQVHLRWEGLNNVRKFAYVVAWELTHGPVPEGKVVCHNCPTGDDPNCCNPSHLFIGTQADNVHDAIFKQRRNAFGIQKLHPPQVREIRARAAMGEYHYRIASDYNIARNTVTGIVNRVSWGWLSDHPAMDGVFEVVPSVQLPVVGEVR